MRKPKYKRRIRFRSTREYGRYTQAKEITRVWNTIATGIGFWTFLYPVPYVPLIIMCIILPLIGIYLMSYYCDQVELDEVGYSRQPAVVSLLLMPSMALTLRGLVDFSIIYSNNIWIYLSVSSLLLYFFVLKVTTEYKKHRLVLLKLLIFVIPYCFGLISIINCMLDFSQPELFHTTIIDKRISSGKTTSYYIEVMPWGPFSEPSEISVPYNRYEELEKNEKINIRLKNGALRVKWYYIDE